MIEWGKPRACLGAQLARCAAAVVQRSLRGIYIGNVFRYCGSFFCVGELSHKCDHLTQAPSSVCSRQRAGRGDKADRKRANKRRLCPSPQGLVC